MAPAPAAAAPSAPAAGVVAATGFEIEARAGVARRSLFAPAAPPAAAPADERPSARDSEPDEWGARCMADVTMAAAAAAAVMAAAAADGADTSAAAAAAPSAASRGADAAAADGADADDTDDEAARAGRDAAVAACPVEQWVVGHADDVRERLGGTYVGAVVSVVRRISGGLSDAAFLDALVALYWRTMGEWATDATAQDLRIRLARESMQVVAVVARSTAAHTSPASTCLAFAAYEFNTMEQGPEGETGVRTAYLHELHTMAGLRRMGLGTALESEFGRRARTESQAQARLTVLRRNAYAHELYRKLGYRNVKDGYDARTGEQIMWRSMP